MIINKSKKINKCLLCNSVGKFDLIGTSYCPVLSKKYKIVKCETCGLVFLNPMPSEKQLGKIYSQEYREGVDNFVGKLLKFYNDLYLLSDAKYIQKQLCFKKGKVLDIGYGSGDMLLKMGNNWAKFGFDPYAKRYDRKVMQKTKGITVYSNTKKIKKHDFDLIILRNVIEHTASFIKLIKTASTFLKDNGCIFIRTPNVCSIDFKLFGTAWIMMVMGGHQVFFSKNTLERLLHGEKYRTLSLQSYGGSVPLSLKRSLEYRYSITNIYIKLLLLPLSLIYYLGSVLFTEGIDVRGVFKKL